MLSIVEIVLPLVVVILLSLPLISVFRGNVSAQSAKARLITHVAGFLGACVLFVLLYASHSPVFAAGSDSITGTFAQGLGFISAAVTTSLGCLGAAFAIASAAPAAIGAFSENSENFGKALIFVALGEGIAIYGLLISILIINKL